MSTKEKEPVNPFDEVSGEISNLEALQELRSLAVGQLHEVLEMPTEIAPDLTHVAVQNLVSSVKQDHRKLQVLQTVQNVRKPAIQKLELALRKMLSPHVRDEAFNASLHQIMDQANAAVQKHAKEIARLIPLQTQRRKTLHRMREFKMGRNIPPEALEFALQEMQTIIERDDKELQELRNHLRLLGCFH